MSKIYRYRSPVKPRTRGRRTARCLGPLPPAELPPGAHGAESLRGLRRTRGSVPSTSSTGRCHEARSPRSRSPRSRSRRSRSRLTGSARRLPPSRSPSRDGGRALADHPGQTRNQQQRTNAAPAAGARQPTSRCVSNSAVGTRSVAVLLAERLDHLALNAHAELADLRGHACPVPIPSWVSMWPLCPRTGCSIRCGRTCRSVTPPSSGPDPGPGRRSGRRRKKAPGTNRADR